MLPRAPRPPLTHPSVTPSAAKPATQNEGRGRRQLLGLAPRAAAEPQGKTHVPMARKAKAQRELKVASVVSDNKKGLFRDGNSKRRKTLGLILDEDGPLANKDAVKAEAFHDFFASVFNTNDRPRAARSSESEDHDCGNSDLPFVDPEIVRGQLYPLNVPKSTGPWWHSSQSTEGASGCYSRTPLNHLSKVLRV